RRAEAGERFRRTIREIALQGRIFRTIVTEFGPRLLRSEEGKRGKTQQIFSGHERQLLSGHAIGAGSRDARFRVSGGFGRRKRRG
ncbi:MAG: hypothetical protein LBF21_01780, partial [Puniceicoccales bacterium]|nr:hypothetical protein [Puniceicoccales bacterium]